MSKIVILLSLCCLMSRTLTEKNIRDNGGKESAQPFISLLECITWHKDKDIIKHVITGIINDNAFFEKRKLAKMRMMRTMSMTCIYILSQIWTIYTLYHSEALCVYASLYIQVWCQWSDNFMGAYGRIVLILGHAYCRTFNSSPNYTNWTLAMAFLLKLRHTL